METSLLDQMRARVVSDGLPDTCQIIRNTFASDGRGGQVLTPAVLATVQCRYAQFRMPVEQPAGGAMTAIERYDFTFAWNVVPILTSDQLIVVATGVTYEVTDVARGSYLTGVRVEAVELK